MLIVCCREAWEKATSVARAFGIGRYESESVSNLMTRIDERVTSELSRAVKTRGMARFVTHECIAKGVLNTGWTSGVAAFEQWKEELRNGDDCELDSRQFNVCRLLCNALRVV